MSRKLKNDNKKESKQLFNKNSISMKKIYIVLVLLFGLTSCVKETTQEETLESVSLSANPTNCSDIKINPLWFTTRGYLPYSSGDKVKRLNQYCNPIYLTCRTYNGYVTSNKIVGYDRVVEVYYVYKSTNKCSLKKDAKDYDGILATEQFVIPANSNKSDTRIILENFQFEAMGTITSYVANVQRNGVVQTCYEGTSISGEFINCYEKPREDLVPDPRFDPVSNYESMN